MGLSYLKGASWRSITREERYFCSHLYRLIETKGVRDFVSYINLSSKCALDPDANWEAAYEVCFYRDFLRYHGKPAEKNWVKRTIDLCLLSDKTIVIIEAKAQMGFDRQQMTLFDQDKIRVKRLTNVNAVSLLALSSNKYRPRPDTVDRFDGWLYWDDLAQHYQNDAVLQRANEVYRA